MSLLLKKQQQTHTLSPFPLLLRILLYIENLIHIIVNTRMTVIIIIITTNTTLILPLISKPVIQSKPLYTRVYMTSLYIQLKLIDNIFLLNNLIKTGFISINSY